MHWNWLSGPLKLHCHWLWTPLHWIHQHPSICLFVCFIVVGFLQIALAVYAGALTAKSLPETFSRRRRNFHLGMFVVGGLVLFVFTAMLGILNDQGQQEADARSALAQTDLEQNGRGITGLSVATTALSQKFGDLVHAFNPKTLTNDQRTKFAQTGRSVRQVVAAVARLPQEPVSRTPTVQTRPSSCNHLFRMLNAHSFVLPPRMRITRLLIFFDRIRQDKIVLRGPTGS